MKSRRLIIFIISTLMRIATASTPLSLFAQPAMTAKIPTSSLATRGWPFRTCLQAFSPGEAALSARNLTLAQLADTARLAQELGLNLSDIEDRLQLFVAGSRLHRFYQETEKGDWNPEPRADIYELFLKSTREIEQLQLDYREVMANATRLHNQTWTFERSYFAGRLRPVVFNRAVGPTFLETLQTLLQVAKKGLDIEEFSARLLAKSDRAREQSAHISFQELSAQVLQDFYLEKFE